MWYNYFDSIGAWNQNVNNILASEFIVNADTFELPINPNSGWFDVISGITYSCANTLVCSNITARESDGNTYAKAVVNDSNITTDFISEGKSIAKQYIFEQLKNDSTLLNSDTTLTNFFITNTDSTFGKLSSVNSLISESTYINPDTIELITNKI